MLNLHGEKNPQGVKRDGKILSDHRQDGNVEGHRLYLVSETKKIASARNLDIIKIVSLPHSMST